MAARTAHADYPHHPGTLPGCPACEAECFCDDLNAGQVGDGDRVVCVACDN